VIYVSAQRGNDANAGTLGAPFREISKAIEQSSTGETVVVLDSGDYAKFSVNKSLTIVADGVYAEVSAAVPGFEGTAVMINAAATDVVVLRGLTIKGTGGTVGIWFNSGKTLRLEKCKISNFVTAPDGFPGHGIQVDHGVLTVKDTVLRTASTSPARQTCAASSTIAGSRGTEILSAYRSARGPRSPSPEAS
jgi:Protein of unknown function (DUF1565)